MRPRRLYWRAGCRTSSVAPLRSSSATALTYCHAGRSVLGERGPLLGIGRPLRDDLAILWIDSHPDVGTPEGEYPGYHAMDVAALTGHGDPDVLSQPSWHQSGSRWSGCTPGPKTITPTSQSGASTPSARMNSASPMSRCWTGWPPQAALGWRSISTLTPLTATKSCWAGRRAQRSHQRSAAPDRHRRKSRRGRGRIYRRGILPRQVMHMQQILEGLPLIGDPPK